MLTQARRFEDLQVDHEGKSIPEQKPVDTQPRTATKLLSLKSDADAENEAV